MNVRRIEMNGFTSHAETVIDLPESGVVLVSGHNGSGKSSLVEAVAVAGWGKTLRGTNPWSGSNGQVEMSTDVVDACRLRRGGKVALNWWEPGLDAGSGTSYENTTKAQEALETIIGPMDVWRRTRVFSSQDAAHFTTATDAERKRLLEAVLGLGRFDVALEHCRKDLATACLQFANCERSLEVTEAELRGERKRLADAEAALRAVPLDDIDSLAQKLKENTDAATLCEAEMRSLRSTIRTMTQAAAKSHAELDVAQRQLRELTREDCPTCKQSITEDLRGPLKATVASLCKKTRKTELEHEAKLSDINDHARELDDALSVYVERRESFRAQLIVSQKTQKERDRAEKLVNELRLEVVAKDAEARYLHEEKQRSAAEVELLEATSRVLGMKGVRAHVLGKALSGIEHVANAWLSELTMSGQTPTYSISLKPYAEKKTGGVTDAISIEVEGAGGGHGYRAASGGERRRIDVALLLALAEVADAASGRKPGTLFFDEVFDSLDADGVEFVARALGTLSKDRAVVVISHSDELAAHLNGCLHMHVDSGRISKKR